MKWQAKVEEILHRQTQINTRHKTRSLHIALGFPRYAFPIKKTQHPPPPATLCTNKEHEKADFPCVLTVPHWDSQDGVGDGVRLLSGAGSVLSLLPCYPASGNRASPQAPETLPLCRLSSRYFQHSHCQLQHSPPKIITERSVSHSTINSYCFSLKADCPPQLTWSLLLCESDNTKGKQAVLYQLHVCYTACSCPLPDTCNAQRKYLQQHCTEMGEKEGTEYPLGYGKLGLSWEGCVLLSPSPCRSGRAAEQRWIGLRIWVSRGARCWLCRVEQTWISSWTSSLLWAVQPLLGLSAQCFSWRLNSRTEKGSKKSIKSEGGMLGHC